MTDALSALPECSYDGIVFPVERAEWDGGNDLVEHVAYRRPGADVEPTGRKAYRGTLTIPLVNAPRLVARYGELFPGLRFDLLTRFEERPIATLVHPTLGQITAAIGEVSETAEAGDRGGVRMTVRWVEHNASVALLLAETASGDPVDAAKSASKLAEDADTEVSALTSSYTPMQSVVDERLAFLDAAPRTYTETAESIRRMLAPVAANLALAALASASAHAATLACINLRSAIYALRDRLIPSALQQRYYTTPREMALWEVSVAVYGDAGYTTLLRSANGIADPTSIRAGKRLVILPVPGV